MLTIHTLGYQGICDPWWLGKLPEHAASYAWYDVCNPLVGGIRLADSDRRGQPHVCHARSSRRPRAKDTSTSWPRAGARWSAFSTASTLRNGTRRPTRTSPRDTTSAPSHAARRRADARCSIESGLADVDGEPVIGVVSRLVDQKGIDLFVECMPFIERLRARVVVLGSGDRWLADALAECGGDVAGSSGLRRRVRR